MVSLGRSSIYKSDQTSSTVVNMTKQNAKRIDEQLKRDEDEYSGEGTVSGSSPDPESDDNTSDNLAQVIGNQPKQKFNIGDEINEGRVCFVS